MLGDDYMGFGFDMFNFVSMFIPIIFVIVFGVIIVTLIKGIMEWSSNNKEPVLSVISKVVTKRTNTTRHHNNNNNHMSSHNSTSYYATFEVESGDRLEFAVSGKEYGMLVEGDIGKLVFQGTRYHSFDRN